MNNTITQVYLKVAKKLITSKESINQITSKQRNLLEILSMYRK